MTEEKLSKIKRGFLDADEDILRGGIVRKGYEKEFARLLLKKLGRKAVSLFTAENSDLTYTDSDGVTDRVHELIPSGVSGARFAEFFTGLYVGEYGALRLCDIFANDADEDYEPSFGISFVSGGSIDLSYKVFAEKLAFPRETYPVHTQRLSAACDAVLENEAGFAIIPIRSASDGRLRSFYRTIYTYDMKIVSAAVIGTDENEMHYALCARQYRPMSSLPSRIEISLPADGEEALAVALAARELGYELNDMSSSPSERDGEIYSFTFTAKREVFPLILYLNLYHPGYTLLGLYDLLYER